MFLDPKKTRAARFLNGFKNIPQKACVLGVRTKGQIVGEDISLQEKTSYALSVFFI